MRMLALIAFLLPATAATPKVDKVGYVVQPSETDDQFVEYPTSPRVFVNGPGTKPVYVVPNNVMAFNHDAFTPRGQVYGVLTIRINDSEVTGTYSHFTTPELKTQIGTWSGRLQKCPDSPDKYVVWTSGASELNLGYANTTGLQACITEQQLRGRNYGEILGGPNSETGVFVVR